MGGFVRQLLLQRRFCAVALLFWGVPSPFWLPSSFRLLQDVTGEPCVFADRRVECLSPLAALYSAVQRLLSLLLLEVARYISLNDPEGTLQPSQRLQVKSGGELGREAIGGTWSASELWRLASRGPTWHCCSYVNENKTVLLNKAGLCATACR